ncbi:uncharacterized protein [Epargyreus clarus]|uniref:uncharacterized protein isoform X2 n=1 Tax=Epargyreus clarus TaxID=520877 RepID=UPI003C2EB798
MHHTNINTWESMEKAFQEMLAEPAREFHNFCRMSITDFELLLQKLGPIISKQDTTWRDCIPSKVRLAVTLRYLASGDSYRSLHGLFNISTQIISKIVQEVCAALCHVLKVYIKMPDTDTDWLSKECGFRNRFPHAVGVIDGKLIVMQVPNNCASEKIFDIVLLSLIDSNHCFMFADIGSESRTRHSYTLRNSVFWSKMENNMLDLPSPTPLQNEHIFLPYVFLGDDTFPLNDTIMKPYPGKHQEGTKETIFNKNFLSAHAVVENTFGVMASVFRVLRKPILLQPEQAIKVVMSCVVLHNFMRKSKHSSALYNPPGTFDTYNGNNLVSMGSWRNDIPDHATLRNICPIQTRSYEEAEEIREEFARSFHQFVIGNEK